MRHSTEQQTLRRPVGSAPGAPGSTAPHGSRPRAAPGCTGLVIDAESRVLHAQGDAFSRHGLSVDGWAGRALDELLPTEVAGVLLPRYRDALRGIAQAFDHHTLDGTRTYRIQIAPIPDSEGESVIGFGQTASRHGDDTLAISMLWVIRLQDGQIAALQVFQTPAWSPPPGVSAPAP